MQDVKLTRRVVGMLAAGLKVAQPELVTDPRAEKGRQWALSPLLNLLVASLMAGKKSLAEVEEFSGELTPETRRRLKLKGQVPDTTLRDVVVRLQQTRCGASSGGWRRRPIAGRRLSRTSRSIWRPWTARRPRWKS